MKKRIFALIMAGLLTASLASCVSTGTKDTNVGSENKPPIHNGDNGNGNNNLPQQEFVAVDKNLYVVTDKAALRAEATASGKVLTNLPLETEVKCTKQNGTWSYVEFGDTAGYVLNSALTDVDILAKKFVAVEGGEKTMYVIETSLNIRRYPATGTELSASISMGTLSWNDEVTVVSTNDKWSRIKYEKDGKVNYYFVYSEFLSAEKQIDFNDPSQYEDYFEACDRVTRYTKGTVYLRSSPYLGSNKNIKTDVKGDTPVTVVATGTIAGVHWSRVSVRIEPTNPADSPYYEEGYISSAYLTEKPSTAPVVLKDLLALYPGLNALSTSVKMYATANVYIRTTPENFSSSYTDNKATVLSKQEGVTVVASGTYNGYDCYVIEYTIDKKDGYYFVLSDFLTTNPDGTPMLTLDSIKAFYKEFTVLEGNETYAATVSKESANCYLTPKNGESPATTLKRGTAVTVVAVETGSINNAWVVIRTADGALYFIAKDAVQAVSG